MSMGFLCFTYYFKITTIASCFQVGTMVEVAGYWPTFEIRTQDLFPDQSENEEGSQFQSDLKKVIYTSKQPFFLKATKKVQMFLKFKDLAQFKCL